MTASPTHKEQLLTKVRRAKVVAISFNCRQLVTLTYELR